MGSVNSKSVTLVLQRLNVGVGPTSELNEAIKAYLDFIVEASRNSTGARLHHHPKKGICLIRPRNGVSDVPGS